MLHRSKRDPTDLRGRVPTKKTPTSQEAVGVQYDAAGHDRAAWRRARTALAGGQSVQKVAVLLYVLCQIQRMLTD